MTARFGTRAWRDDALADLGYDLADNSREIILQAFVFVEVSKEMQPKVIIRRQTQSKKIPTKFFSLHISPYGIRLKR